MSQQPPEAERIEIPPVPERVKEAGIGAIVAALIEAIKELRAELDALKAR